MRHDTLSDVFVTIKNAENIGKNECRVPVSKLTESILKIMKENRYIGDFREDKEKMMFTVNLLGKINNTNAIRPRLSVARKDIVKYEKRYLPAQGVGILILTTPNGVMDQKTAAEKNTGGKLLGFVY